MRLVLIVGSGVGAVGLFLLATASSDTTFFAQQYPLLLALNAAFAAMFAALVIYQLGAMARRYRARVFGTRLTLRMFLRFAALAVLPGLIVYAVSVQFLTRSIESWFDVKVDAALEGGINLGQQVVDQMLIDLQTKARTMALELADIPAAQLVTNLERLRLQAGVQEALVINAKGRLLELASHRIERFGKHAELVAARNRRGTREVAACHRLHRLGERGERLGEEPRLRDRDGDGDRKCHQQREAERHHVDAL